MVLSCHSEKLARYLDPFIPNTVYSYSLKQKIDVDLDDEHWHCLKIYKTIYDPLHAPFVAP